MFACDAIIIGGGAAGIGAARELRKAGLQQVLILEARQRLGGRSHSSDELGCGVSLDKGAQWIHGYSPTHPMVQLADELDRFSGPMASRFSTTVLSDGRDVSRSEARKAGQTLHDLRKQIAGCQSTKDCSWKDASESMGGLRELSPDAQAVFNLNIYNRYENYEGARLDRWSTRSWNKVTELKGGNGDVAGGYGALIVEAAQDLQVRLGRQVESIKYRMTCEAAPQVVVRCKSTDIEDSVKETYCALCCIVTLPLGVLRAGYVDFKPELPQDKMRAINTLGISLMDKVELLWHRRWWPSGINSFQIASLNSTPTFHPWPWFDEPAAMRNHPLGWTALVCYTTGQFAEHVESLSEDEAVAECLAALRSAFPAQDVPDPEETHITHWSRDSLSHGSWSYFAVGSSPDDVRALREPVGPEGCVAFAGEHTCDGSVLGLDMGTVHGAWLSGEIAASGLLERVWGRSLASPSPGMWRCSHRHCTDSVIPEIDGYRCGLAVEVTHQANEIAEEFCTDPDEAPEIATAQMYCGKRGIITARSSWGWLLVEFDDNSAPRWWTPYCLWVVDTEP